MLTSTRVSRQHSSDDGVSNHFVTDNITLRKAEHRDLGQINTVIAAAMDTWRQSERVKRLSLPLYRYDARDLDHLQAVVAETEEGTIAGIATIEAADALKCPQGHSAALLHGIYVDPLLHRGGIGTRLLKHMQVMAASMGFDGLLVKANPEATAFFEAEAFEKLPIENPSREYPHRYWKAL